MDSTLHRPQKELQRGLPHVQASPTDYGKLDAIIIRPTENERRSLERCQLSPDGGVHGDSWAHGCWLSLENGAPHPDVQIAIINSRTIELLASSKERWSLAGDNLYVDLDLSRANLKTGDLLRLGECLIEITDQAHNGCRKFAERYGKDAVAFVNSAAGKELRLRGVYAKVIEAGEIQVGDVISKVDVPNASA